MKTAADFFTATVSSFIVVFLSDNVCVTVVTVFQIPVPLSQKPSPPSRTVTGNIMQLNSATIAGSAAFVDYAVLIVKSARIDIQPLCN